MSLQDADGVLTPGSRQLTPSALALESTPSRQTRNAGGAKAWDGTSTENSIDCWVTVFGFKPSMTAEILEHFTNRQLIVLGHVSGNANSMDIQFATPTQAQLAMEEDGAKINVGSASIYIGVKRTHSIAMQQRRVPVTLPRNLGRVVGAGNPGGTEIGQRARLRHSTRAVRNKYRVMDRISIMKPQKHKMTCCEMVRNFLTQGW